LVTAADWESVSAKCQRFERANPKAAWSEIAPPFEVVIGRNGLAWGIGLHGTHPGAGPVKKEGDGCAPAGVFLLRSAFGYASERQVNLSAFPYIALTRTSEGVDDPASRYYNRVIDAAAVTDKDWKSSERMLRTDDLYRWGVIVEHNREPVPGGGSCIFLHTWSGPRLGTAGCTAMPADKVEGIVRWLKKAGQPVLIQLPVAEYLRHKGEWHLP
jgi:D-alanyl-D-alanine dipeptidase